MKLTYLLLIAAPLALAACDSQPTKPEVVDTNPDPMANTLANSGPVVLPPSILAEATLRCDDNSLTYVTFYSGDTQVDVQLDKAGPKTRLTAPAAGQAYVADGGWSLTGTPKKITLASPGKKSQSCEA